MSNNSSPRWELIQTDVFSSKEGDSIAGFIQYQLSFGLAQELTKIPRKLLEKPKMKSYQLRAFIYQARDLPSGDEDGAW